MQKRPVGRPKKVGAKTSGQLNKGECRYTFITTLEIVNDIKRESSRRKMSIKNYLNSLICKNLKELPVKVIPTDEDKLKEYLKKTKGKQSLNSH